jgi:hypothetical protein
MISQPVMRPDHRLMVSKKRMAASRDASRAGHQSRRVSVRSNPMGRRGVRHFF